MVAIGAIQGHDVQQRGARHVSDDGHGAGVQTGARILQSERRSIRRLPRQAHIPREAGSADNLLAGSCFLSSLGRPDALAQPHPRCAGRRPVAAQAGEELAAHVSGAHQQ